MIQRKAKSFMGHEQDWWPPLQEETIARKAKGNTPLLETGELRDSIEITAPVHEGGITAGYVGSNNDKAIWHEQGTRTIPPRPFLMAAAVQSEQKIHDMAARMVRSTMENGGANYRDLKHIIHILKEAGHKLKELWPVDDEDEQK